MRLVWFSGILLAGRRFWALPLLPLCWLALEYLRLVFGWANGFSAADAQGELMGVPLVAIAIPLGARIIAGEIEERRVEIAYMTPAGVRRVWTAKMTAAAMVLVAAALASAVVVGLFLTPYPTAALYGALQGAFFFGALAMAAAVIFHGEMTGSMIAAAAVGITLVVTRLGALQLRISPLWNPAAIDQAAPADLLTWTLQNRIGMLVAIAALVAIGVARAGNREAMLAR